jgi:hypothetical protein
LGIVFIGYPGGAAITCCMPSLMHRSLDSEGVAASTANAWGRRPIWRSRFGKKPKLIPSTFTVNPGMFALMTQ